MSMYRCDTPCPSNEELALRIRDGDPHAAPLLLSQNEGYLTMLATSYCEQFSQDFLVDDLKQEGALALLDAARRFDLSKGTKLLTYATSAIETAMRPAGAVVAGHTFSPPTAICQNTAMVLRPRTPA